MAASTPAGISGPVEKVILTDIRALRRALESGASVEKVVWRQGTAPPAPLWQLVRQHRLPFQQVPPTQLPHHSSWAAYLSPLPLYSLESWLEEPPAGIALALLGITDPHNVGAILRSAAAFGVKWVLLKAEKSPLLSNEALWRSSAGSLPHLRIVRTSSAHQALTHLQERGWTLAATTPPTPHALPYHRWNWHQPTLLLLGSEDKGLPPEYLRSCSLHLTIPHEPCVQSLNVSVAAAILLAESYARRNKP